MLLERCIAVPNPSVQPVMSKVIIETPGRHDNGGWYRQPTAYRPRQRSPFSTGKTYIRARRVGQRHNDGGSIGQGAALESGLEGTTGRHRDRTRLVRATTQPPTVFIPTPTPGLHAQSRFAAG